MKDETKYLKKINLSLLETPGQGELEDTALRKLQNKISRRIKNFSKTGINDEGKFLKRIQIAILYMPVVGELEMNHLKHLSDDISDHISALDVGN